MAATKGERPRPTVIVSPNDAVQVQWRDSLYNNGVLLEHIQEFEKGQRNRDFDKPIFLLLTRHRLQSEVKRVFKNLDNLSRTPDLATSVLFPYAKRDNLKLLRMQYQVENSKLRIRNTARREGERVTDCVTRLINLCALRMKRDGKESPFFTLVIDEAHFLKNITTYWGIGGALLAVHAHRRAPLTGTPYNNSASDLATMMSFVDTAKSSAYRQFWVRATSGQASEQVLNNLKSWCATYLVRRKKDEVLTDLVPKVVRKEKVPQYVAEMAVYEYYEDSLQKVLKQFAQTLDYDTNNNPAVREYLKELFTILMALMSNMRAANVHEMLPNGREYTKQFSPSRCHLLAKEERPRKCVYCDRNMRTTIPVAGDDDVNGASGRNGSRRPRKGNTNIDRLVDGEEIDDDDDSTDDLVLDQEQEEELVCLPSELCDVSAGVRHFAHPKCIHRMKKESFNSCPRCQHAKKAMKYQLPNGDNKMYCQEIHGGFAGSSKINAIIDYIRAKVPDDDKCVIFSFFRGSLDLIEGILHYDEEIDCARFDGDLDKSTSLAELERFKSDPNCKCLLATVQKAGVGLNITQANHVLFCDRWFNPFVLDQAEVCAGIGAHALSFVSRFCQLH